MTKMKVFAKIAFVALTLFAMSNMAFAQKYAPKDKWPYIYADFQNGNVKVSRGPLFENVPLNVSVADGKLHYIKDGTIMEVDMNTVVSAKVGEDVYLKTSGKMMKVLAEVEGGAVLLYTSIDTEEMGKTNIGYGISSSTATSQNVTTLLDNVNDMSSAMVNMLLSDADISKENGKVVPVTSMRYIYFKGMSVPASKSDVVNAYGVDKDQVNAFIKQHKIKWSSVESLAELAEFLAK